MEQRPKTTIKEMILAAMFAAILAVLTQLSLPMPSGVPVTLQTFAVAVVGYVLGRKWGLISVMVYIMMGIVGVPVFAGFRGGIGVLFDKTGGFVFGFLFMVFFCGWASVLKRRIASAVLAGVGLLICHLCGILQFAFLTEMGFVESAVLVSLPYLIKDILSVIAAFCIGAVLKHALHRVGNSYPV